MQLPSPYHGDLGLEQARLCRLILAMAQSAVRTLVPQANSPVMLRLISFNISWFAVQLCQ